MPMVTPDGTGLETLNSHRNRCARRLLLILLAIGAGGALAQSEKVIDSANPAPAELSSLDSVSEDATTLAANEAPRAEAESIESIVDTEEPRSDNPIIRAAQEQLASNETLQAKTLLTDLIRERESSFDRYNPELIEPLLVLGDVKRAEKDFPGALESYTRAVHIERVNSGLVSPGQLTGVYREAETLAEMGDLKSANDREEHAYITLLRHHGGASMELLPGLLRLADWYMASNNIFSARGLYNHGIDLVEAAKSESDDALIPLLAGLAQTYVRQAFPIRSVNSNDPDPVFDSFTGISSSSQSGTLSLSSYSQAEKALQRIVNIELAREPLDVQALVAAELAFADWHLMFLSTGRRWLPLYADAHKQLLDAGFTEPNSRFAKPTLLYRPPILNPKAAQDPLIEPATGSVELSFTVNDRGRVTGSSMTTERADPPGMLDFRVRRAINNAIYRPALVDGVPVDSENIRYRHEFTYWPRNQETDDSDSDSDSVSEGADSQPDDAQAETGEESDSDETQQEPRQT